MDLNLARIRRIRMIHPHIEKEGGISPIYGRGTLFTLFIQLKGNYLGLIPNIIHGESLPSRLPVAAEIFYMMMDRLWKIIGNPSLPYRIGGGPSGTRTQDNPVMSWAF